MFESAHLSMRCDYHPDKLADAASLWHHGLPRIPWVPRTVRVNTGCGLPRVTCSAAKTGTGCTRCVVSCGPALARFL